MKTDFPPEMAQFGDLFPEEIQHMLETFLENYIPEGQKERCRWELYRLVNNAMKHSVQQMRELIR